MRVLCIDDSLPQETAFLTGELKQGKSYEVVEQTVINGILGYDVGVTRHFYVGKDLHSNRFCKADRFVLLQEKDESTIKKLTSNDNVTSGSDSYLNTRC